MASPTSIDATVTAAEGVDDRRTTAMSTVRPLVAGLVVFALALLAARGVPYLPPSAPMIRYSLEAVALSAVLIGGLCSWIAMRRGATWDAELWPAILGGVAVFSLNAVLHGTPFAPNGIQGDQAFRTETITRFADTWALVDFTQKDLPAFYAPAYFWVLGRIADLTDLAPWRFVQWGTTVVAMVIPILAFLLWRRHVSSRLAALIAAVPLIVQNWYEPYAWLVVVAIVPWWLEVVHGHLKPGTRPWHPLVLGAIGALLFLTYYYFFFIAAVALAIHLVVELTGGRLDREQLLRPLVPFALTVAFSAVFWVPLLVSILAAEHPQSLANRWFSDSHGIPRLPFLEPSVTGVLSLVGLVFLAATATRELLSRALLVFLAAAYAWFVIGWPAALIGYPLLSFRGGPVVSMLLLIAGILGVARIVTFTWDHRALSGRAHLARTALWLAIGIFYVFAVRSYAVGVFSSPHIQRAYDEPLPNGQVLGFSTRDPDAPYASAEEIAAEIDARYSGADHPVLLSTRSDILAYKPYYGFVQWQAYYSHPAAEFSERIAFLEELAALTDPTLFAEQSADNGFDRIDAFVLRATGGGYVFDFRDDAFPEGAAAEQVTFRPELFDAGHFDVVQNEGYVIAVRRAGS